MAGIGHGEVFTEPLVVVDEDDQLTSPSQVGSFVVYGANLNPVTIYESPWGTAEVFWTDAGGEDHSAVLPILERDEIYGIYFVVGVPRDSRYDPATFSFNSIEYNDFVVQESIHAFVPQLKSCNNSATPQKTCAPLAPMAAYKMRCRNPFLPKAYFSSGGV
jgi:hypothetical protein